MSAADSAPVQRPEDEDDYDLLTYNEVAARLSEVLIEEREQLAVLRAATPADPAVIAAQESRIAELAAGRDRYARQQQTAETFMRRFGLPARGPG